jgi:signal transduction histidine kinase
LDVGKIFAHKDRALLLVPVVALNMVPPLLGALSHPDGLARLGAFTAAVVVCLAAFILWLLKCPGVWAKWVVLLVSCGMTAWFTFAFQEMFDNSYLAGIPAAQLIFLLLGPRCGMAMLGFALLGNLYYLLSNPGAVPTSNVFAFTVQATVGVLSWIFVAGLMSTKERAEQLAEEATSAKEEAQRLAEEVTQLNRFILISQDNERRRVARDIHDGSLQSMGVAMLAAERVRRRLDAGECEHARRELDYLRRVVQETSADLRTTVSALRNTLLDSGIEPALRNLARKIAESSGLRMELSLEPVGDVPETLQSCLYQLAVEALNNVKKHARAQTVWVVLEQSAREITLTISDDGVGFDYERAVRRALRDGHIGLHSMTERAAEYSGHTRVISRPGGGTEVRFTFPWCAPALDEPAPLLPGRVPVGA